MQTVLWVRPLPILERDEFGVRLGAPQHRLLDGDSSSQPNIRGHLIIAWQALSDDLQLWCWAYFHALTS